MNTIMLVVDILAHGTYCFLHMPLWFIQISKICIELYCFFKKHGDLINLAQLIRHMGAELHNK